MAEEREYWLPPYWDASELFLDREGVVRRDEWYGEEKPEKGPCRDCTGD